MVLSATVGHDTPPPHWARIEKLGSEPIFGVCVVTFDPWHLAILLDWVQDIMLVSQGKVLSPGNERAHR